MSLTDLINQSIKTTTSDDQVDWRQFILDHLDYIAARSTTFSIDPPLMNQYRYDLKRMLKVYFKRHQDMEWIVLLLNNLPNDFSFYEPMSITIPSDELITNLYHSYITIASNAS